MSKSINYHKTVLMRKEKEKKKKDVSSDSNEDFNTDDVTMDTDLAEEDDDDDEDQSVNSDCPEEIATGYFSAAIGDGVSPNISSINLTIASQFQFNPNQADDKEDEIVDNDEPSSRNLEKDSQELVDSGELIPDSPDNVLPDTEINSANDTTGMLPQVQTTTIEEQPENVLEPQVNEPDKTVEEAEETVQDLNPGIDYSESTCGDAENSDSVSDANNDSGVATDSTPLTGRRKKRTISAFFQPSKRFKSPPEKDAISEKSQEKEQLSHESMPESSRQLNFDDPPLSQALDLIAPAKQTVQQKSTEWGPVEPDDDDDQEETVLTDEELRILAKVMNKLPEKKRNVISKIVPKPGVNADKK